jgi:hypothetical protein
MAVATMALMAACQSTVALPTHGGTEDAATHDAPSDGADAGITCAGSLPDAGFTLLDDLPIAQLCAVSAASGYYGNGVVKEYTTPCQGSILVWSPVGADCTSMWLFDAQSRALQAVVGDCNGSYRCEGAIPRFQFPSQCFPPTVGWGLQAEELCPDGGSASGADAMSE